MTTTIARDDLVRFLTATGHPPRIVPVSRRHRRPRRRLQSVHGHHLIGHNPTIRASRGRGPPRATGPAGRHVSRLGQYECDVTTGAAPAADGLIKDTTTQTFVKDVIEESKRQPVLVDFWAPWCGPCKQLTPILEKAVKAAKGKVKLVKMNIDEHPAVPRPDGHPVDPGGDRLRQRPAGRRLHGRAAGEPGDPVPGAAHQGQDRRRGEGRAGGRRRGARAGRRDHRRRASMRRCWPQDAANVAALAGLARSYRADRRDRAGQADARDGAGGQAATMPRSRPRAPRSKSPSRRSRSARSTS